MESCGGGAAGGNSCSVGFGENVSGMSSMMMMMPFMTPFSSSNPSSSTSNNNDNQRRCYQLMQQQQNHIDSDSRTGSGSSMRVKIMSHPHYLRLLAAYINCQKIGAPAEVVAKLEDTYASGVAMLGTIPKSCVGQDPTLDQFMEAYIEMLTKYEQELSKPFRESMAFLSRAEAQLNAFLTVSSSNTTGCHMAVDRDQLSEEDADADDVHIDPKTEDKELKIKLLRKYSGYLGGLKQEFMKKKKTGKLPKEARQQLMDWWSKHHKWPYPSESQKVALAESTGLDQKQINNWFINQRKRHWKPSEEMQLAVLEGMHPQYYMNTMLTNPFSMDCSPLL